ncbi:TPA: hypothetical protein KPJ78_003813 [Clostridioides difficile]|nr:hypothetical protein [Clostridioides difficile]
MVINIARPRNPNRDRAREIYKEKNGKIELLEISDILNEKLKNIQKWKSVDKWDAHIKRGGQPGNKNALGNNGGAPIGNKNSSDNYLCSSFKNTIPRGLLKVWNSVYNDELNPLDYLWASITLQYSKIIYAINITHVKNKKDHTIDITKEDGEKYKEYQIQHSWDKELASIKAITSAFNVLTRMIKDYEELLHKNWDLATEEQKSRIENIKARTNKLTGNNLEIEDIEDIEAEIYGSN